MPHTPNENASPEPLPAGARWTPPGLPPAPPGGGTGGPPGDGPFRRGSGGAPGEPELVAALCPLLNDLAVARTVFETMDCYPDDPNLRSELMSIVEDARRDLVRQLDVLLERLATQRPPFADDVLRGLQVTLLSSSAPFGSFGLIVSRSRDALECMPPREFALLVLDHFKAAVQDDPNYESGATFDAEIYQGFQALLFAAELSFLKG